MGTEQEKKWKQRLLSILLFLFVKVLWCYSMFTSACTTCESSVTHTVYFVMQNPFVLTNLTWYQLNITICLSVYLVTNSEILWKMEEKLAALVAAYDTVACRLSVHLLKWILHLVLVLVCLTSQRLSYGLLPLKYSQQQIISNSSSFMSL